MLRSYTPRHEIKFFLSLTDAVWLSSKLASALDRDVNAGPDGSYLVRSLYLDDAFDSAYYDKVAGNASRDKYRVRMYKMDDRVILLERKRKLGDLIQKDSAQISRRMAERIESGDPTGFERVDNALIKDLYREMRTKLLRPVVLVDYAREAFCHPAENARVTIDRYLRAGPRTGLFDPGVPTLPALDVDQAILEVKFDHVLPDYIASLLWDAPATHSAISKYVACRRFEPLR
jgi:hypothetical protein